MGFRSTIGMTPESHGFNGTFGLLHRALHWLLGISQLIQQSLAIFRRRYENVGKTMPCLHHKPPMTGNGLYYITYKFMLIFLGDGFLHDIGNYPHEIAMLIVYACWIWTLEIHCWIAGKGGSSWPKFNCLVHPVVNWVKNASYKCDKAQ